MTEESENRRKVERREVLETRAAFRALGVPGFEVEFLADGQLVRRAEDLYVAINTFLFRSGTQGSAAVEMGLRFDLFGHDRRLLRSFGVNSRFAIEAMREVNRHGEKLPIPAVEHEPGGDPMPKAELMLTISRVQVEGEPDELQPSLCFGLAHLDHSSICNFGLYWRWAVLAMSLAFEDDEEEPDDVEELSTSSNPHPPSSL